MAEMSDYTRCPIGCVAVYKNRIIGCGFNSHRTHPLQHQYNQYRHFGNNAGGVLPKLHAEVATVVQMQNLDIDFSKVEIYIYRKCKSREMGISKPCPACTEAIRSLGIRKIFFTTDNGLAFLKLTA